MVKLYRPGCITGNASGCPVMQPDVFAPLRDSTAEINNITDLQQIKIFLALKLFNVAGYINIDVT